MADSVSLPAGREADVSRQPDGRLLRRYRDARDTRPEADLMHYLHQQGYPVPRVYSAVGRDLVMKFVEGPTMAEAALSGAVSQAEGMEGQRGAVAGIVLVLLPMLDPVLERTRIQSSLAAAKKRIPGKGQRNG